MAADIVTTGIAAASAVASAVSAYASLKSARNSNKTATESRNALAYATRPYLTAHMHPNDGYPSDATSEAVEIRNPSAFSAVDILVRVRNFEGKSLGSGGLQLMESSPPNSWSGEADLKIDLSRLSKLQEVGDLRKLIVTIRFSDQGRLKKWEQQVKMFRSVIDGTESDPRKTVFYDLFETSEPKVIQ